MTYFPATRAWACALGPEALDRCAQAAARSPNPSSSSPCKGRSSLSQILERFLLQPLLPDFLGHQAQRKGYSVENCLGSRRAARDVIVNWNHFVHTAQNTVGIEPAATAGGTGTDREGEFRIRYSIHQPLQRRSDLTRYRAAHQ